MNFMVTTYVIFALSVIIFILIYAVINLYKKLQIAESAIRTAFSVETEINQFIASLLESYVKVYSKLKRIDRLGSFESDDEVGFVFKTLKKTIEELTVFLKDINDRLNNDSDENGKDKNG